MVIYSRYYESEPVAVFRAADAGLKSEADSGCTDKTGYRIGRLRVARCGPRSNGSRTPTHRAAHHGWLRNADSRKSTAISTDADWQNNPMAHEIKSYLVSNQSALKIALAKGGGAAASIRTATPADLKKLNNYSD